MSLRPGAYIIRNCETSTVLQITTWNGHGKVELREKDEITNREHQIWWIEEDPGYEELNESEKATKKGGIYRITSIAKSISLDHAQVDKIVTYSSHGASWQLWRIKLCQSATDEGRYEIRPFRKGSDDVLLHVNDKKQPVVGKPQIPMPGPMAGKWEFVYPLNPIPSGWIFLKNASSQRLLKLTYPSLPPIMKNSDDTLHETGEQPLSYLQRWASQWAIIETKSSGCSPRTFVIQNRLTKTYLHHRSMLFAHKGQTQTATVDACCSGSEDVKLQEWRFEIDFQSNWKIINNQNGCLLEDSYAPLMDGYEVTCATKSPSSRKAWIFMQFHSPATPFDATASIPCAQQ
ncbi:hypothetical protein FPQ18DRAFT_323156 [Pyronema domesticum]|nr:hypothetical protein FPQ18DRAFT_323156 [Pyronema domesticum]